MASWRRGLLGVGLALTLVGGCKQGGHERQPRPQARPNQERLNPPQKQEFDQPEGTGGAGPASSGTGAPERSQAPGTVSGHEGMPGTEGPVIPQQESNAANPEVHREGARTSQPQQH